MKAVQTSAINPHQPRLTIDEASSGARLQAPLKSTPLTQGVKPKMSDTTNATTDRRIFTDRADGASLTLEGVEWGYKIWTDGENDELKHYNKGQIRTVDKSRSGDDYEWSFSWVIYAGGECHVNAPYIVARQYGRCATLEDAAREALAYSPEPREMAGLTWYPHYKNRYLALTVDGQEAEIIVDERGVCWRLSFPTLSKLAGIALGTSDQELRGSALSIEDAVQAILDAPAAFRASIRALLLAAAA